MDSCTSNLVLVMIEAPVGRANSAHTGQRKAKRQARKCYSDLCKSVLLFISLFLSGCGPMANDIPRLLVDTLHRFCLQHSSGAWEAVKQVRQEPYHIKNCLIQLITIIHRQRRRECWGTPNNCSGGAGHPQLSGSRYSNRAVTLIQQSVKNSYSLLTAIHCSVDKLMV